MGEFFTTCETRLSANFVNYWAERVGTVWECALRTKTAIAQTRDMVAAWLHGSEAVLEVGEAEVQIAPCPESDPDAG